MQKLGFNRFKFILKSLIAFSVSLPLFTDLTDRPRNYKDEDHRLFLQKRQECVESLIKMIQKGSSFQKIIDAAANWRNELAKKQLEPSQALQFGLRRKVPLISDPAISGARYLQEKIDLLLKSGVVQDAILKSRFEGVKIYKKIFSEQFFEEKYPLTELSHCDQFYPEKYSYLDYLFPIQDFKYIWVHTDPDIADKIIDFLETVYQTILDDKDPVKAIENVAMFHWFFAHACPYYRGSAAIAEVISQALLWHKGFFWEKTPNLMIDVEALTEPVKEEFMRVYPTFYRQL